jgi:hypothetical protein
MTHDEMDEIRRHFDVVAESLVGKIQQVAEGHGLLVAGQERIVAGLDRLETRIDRFELELKGMVNLSFSELDRRVRTLEESLAALAGRVGRLEGGRPA